MVKILMKNFILAGFFCTTPSEARFWNEPEIGRGQKYTGNPTGEGVTPLDKIPEYITSHFKENGAIQSTDEELHFYPANYTGEKFYTVVYKENGEVLDYQNLKIADATVYMNTLAPKLKKSTLQTMQNFAGVSNSIDYSLPWSDGCFGRLRPLKPARGEPRNNREAAYKAYSSCLECIGKDFEEGEKLSFVRGRYTFCYNLTKKQFFCPKEDKFETVDKWAQCECDAQLANDLAKEEEEYKQEITPQLSDCSRRSSPLGSWGGFAELEKLQSPKSSKSKKSCCGVYPNRFVFTESENRKCCDGKIRNTESC